MMLASVLSIFVAKSQDLVYDGITPAPGSDISSFDFVLKFDFSKIIDTNGTADYGIGWVGFHNDKAPTQEKSVTLYEGTKEDGIVLGRLCTSNYNGKTAGFEAKDFIELNFEGAVPKPGVKYTMVITNQFKVYTVEKGSAAISNSTLDYFKTPIVYEFIGGQASSESISITDCSLSPNQLLESVDNVAFTFNLPVTTNANNPLLIKEDDEIVAASTSTLISEDGLSVTYAFNNVLLYKNHSYSVVLPANAVNAVSNLNEGNKQFSVNVVGTSVEYFPLVSSTPEQNSSSIFSSVKAIFELPVGTEIYKKEGVKCNLSANLYKDSVSEENLIGSLNGVGNGSSITWTNTYSLEPSSTYVVFVPKGQFPLYITSEGKYDYETGNGEVTIVLRTPSVAESGIPKVEFQAPVLGKYNDNGNNVTLSNGDKISEITTIDILQKDLRYSYDGEYLSAMITGNRSIEIYDITEGNPVLVQTSKLAATQYETVTYYYTVYRATVNTLFYEGRKYRLVIPAGTITCAKKALQNFAGNEEYTVDFVGGTPTTVELLDCSLKDNAELSELPIVTWDFKGQFVRNQELSVTLATTAGGITKPTFVSTNNAGNTTVQAFFFDKDGNPTTFRNGEKCTILLPEGLIYNAGDPSIKNEEIRINITGVEKAPVKPDYVNFTVEVNGIATVEQQAVKGEIATFTLNPTDDWKVESVVGATQSAANTYKTLALTADTTVKVELAYEGAWAKEVSTNVYEIEAENIRIFKDGDNIIVEGAKPDQTICVYNIAGLLVNTANSEDGKDRVILTVSKNQEFYIVTVAGKAAKIMMKKP